MSLIKIDVKLGGGFLKELIDQFKNLKVRSVGKKEYYIIVLGNTGVGKSSLLKNLFGASISDKDFKRGTRDIQYYPIELQEEELKLNFVDIPAHPSHYDQFKKELGKLLAGQFTGVLNVCSYGYNDSKVRDSGGSSGFLQVNEDERDWVPSMGFIEERRKTDIEFLNKWCEFATVDAVNWIITVVNKMDVWHTYHLKEEVMGYYSSGEYGRILMERFGSGKNYCLPVVAEIDDFQGKCIKRFPPGRELRETMKNDLASLIGRKVKEYL